jgi:hypothetical protein
MTSRHQALARRAVSTKRERLQQRRARRELHQHVEGRVRRVRERIGAQQRVRLEAPRARDVEQIANGRLHGLDVGATHTRSFVFSGLENNLDLDHRAVITPQGHR